MNDYKMHKLAKAHVTLLMTYSGVGKQEAMAIIGMMMGIVMQEGSQTAVIEPDRGQEGRTSQEATTEPSKADNPGEGAVLAAVGFQCVCGACGNKVYEVNTPIRAKNMGVNALLKAFTPQQGVKALAREDWIVVKDKNGNTLMDCPLCKGDKSVVMLGKEKANQGSLESGVTSVGAGEVKL